MKVHCVHLEVTRDRSHYRMSHGRVEIAGIVDGHHRGRRHHRDQDQQDRFVDQQNIYRVGIVNRRDTEEVGHIVKIG